MKRGIVVAGVTAAMIVFITLGALSQYCGATSPHSPEVASGHIYIFDYKGHLIYVTRLQHLILDYSLYVYAAFISLALVLGYLWKIPSQKVPYKKLY